MAVGSFTPWTTFYGYAGDLDLGGRPEGARTYTVIGAVLLAGLISVDRRGRRSAGLVLSVFLLAGHRNGIDKFGEPYEQGLPGPGLWLVLIGALLLVAGFAKLAKDEPLAKPFIEWRSPKPIVELLIISAAFAALLGVVVHGLSVQESSRFLSLFAFVIGVLLAASRSGILSWFGELCGRHRNVVAGAAGLAALVFPFTQGGNAYWIRVFASILVFACAAIGLNVVVGLAGLLDLGYIAFFGVGAYTGGILGHAGLSHYKLHLPFVVVILIGAIVAALFGVFIGAPTLRLEGDYLAIVTLGFGEIFRICANNDLFHLTRGPNGVSQIPNIKAPGVDFGSDHKVFGVLLPYFANYYFLELILLVVIVIAFTRLNSSRIGRAWVAIREDEMAAQAMGVNTIAMKLLAFGIGAFIAGAAGTVNAHLTTQVSPDSYTFFESILLLAAVVLGGMGSVTGAILGSSALFIIPEKLRFFQEKRLLLFGAALILMIHSRRKSRFRVRLSRYAYMSACMRDSCARL